MLPATLDDESEQKRVFFSWRVSDTLGASIFPTLKLGERGAHAVGHLVDSPTSWHRLRCIPTMIDGRAFFSGGVEWETQPAQQNVRRRIFLFPLKLLTLVLYVLALRVQFELK